MTISATFDKSFWKNKISNSICVDNTSFYISIDHIKYISEYLSKETIYPYTPLFFCDIPDGFLNNGTIIELIYSDTYQYDDVLLLSNRILYRTLPREIQRVLSSYGNVKIYKCSVDGSYNVFSLNEDDVDIIYYLYKYKHNDDIDKDEISSLIYDFENKSKFYNLILKYLKIKIIGENFYFEDKITNEEDTTFLKCLELYVLNEYYNHFKNSFVSLENYKNNSD